MNKTNKLKGRTERECADRLRKFMVEYDQRPKKIALGIIELLDVPFSDHTIYRWFANEQTITLHKWDQIVLYIEFVTKNK